MCLYVACVYSAIVCNIWVNCLRRSGQNVACLCWGSVYAVALLNNMLLLEIVVGCLLRHACIEFCMFVFLWKCPVVLYHPLALAA